MSARQLPASDYQKLKAASRALVATVGGAVAAAGVTRGDHQSVSRYGSAHPDNADRFMPIDVLADLESESEQPVLTRVLAEMSGYLLVPVPRAVGSGTALGRVVAAALKETSQVFVRMADALGDGRLSADEAKEIAAEVNEAMIMLAALKLQVNAEAEDGA